MGTFPSAADVPRAIPQSSERPISGANIPAVQISDAGARTAGQGMETVGRVVAQTAPLIDQYAQQIDATQAQDALNQYRKVKADYTYGPDNGFMKLQGGDVLAKDAEGNGVMQQWGNKLEAATAQIGANLSPRARAAYDARKGEETTAFQSEMAKHTINQTAAYQQGVFKDTTATLVTEASRNADNFKVLDSIADKIAATTTTFAAQNGMPGEAAVKGAVSNVYRAAIEQKIASGDGSGAMMIYNARKDKLDGKDLTDMTRQLETVNVQQTASSYVANMGVDQEKRVAQGIKFFTDAGLPAHVGAGIVANYLHESGFRTDNPNPKDGADGSDSINLAHWNGDRAVAFHQFARANGLDENDINTGMKFTLKEIDEIPGLKAKLQGAKTAGEAAAIFTREFERPKNAEMRAAERSGTADKIYANYGDKQVNAQLPPPPGAEPAQGPPGFLDTRKLTIQNEQWHLNATQQNANDWAAKSKTQQAANQQIIEQRYAAQKQNIDIQQRTLNDNVQDWVTKPDPNGALQTQRPPPAVWNQLTYEQQRSVDSALKYNAEGAAGKTDLPTYYEIQQGLTSSNPATRDEWAAKSLLPYLPKLAKEEFKTLATLQGTVRQGDPKRETTQIRNLNQMVDDTLNQLGIDPTPKAGDSATALKGAEFRRAVQDNINEFEKANGGKKSTPEEQQKIIDKLVTQAAVPGKVWGTNNVPAYTVKIKDVPPAERAKIEDALKRNGMTPTDSLILDLYTTKNAKPK